MAAGQISVHRVESEGDFPQLLQVEEQAYGVSKMMTMLFGQEDGEQDPTFRLRLQNHVRSWREDPACVYLKAVAETGEIVGMGVWYFYTDPSLSRNPWTKIRLPPRANQALCDHYFGALVKAREDTFPSDEPYALMANLVVSPAWQRKGVGKLLLEWGLKVADDKGLKCWIDASPQGLGLYKQCGWQEAKVLEFDLSSWGGDFGDVHRTMCMVRRLKARSS